MKMKDLVTDFVNMIDNALTLVEISMLKLNEKVL